MVLLWQRGDASGGGPRSDRSGQDPVRLFDRAGVDDPVPGRAGGAEHRALASGAFRRGDGTMIRADRKRRFARAFLLACALTLLPGAAPAPGAGTSGSSQDRVQRMLTRLLRAPEFQARVIITRSDPFGGPPDRSEGRLWFLPGRGLRFRAMERGGEDIVADREKGTFLVYRPTDQVLYRAEWDRAPARMRELVLTPERLLDADYRAVRER